MGIGLDVFSDLVSPHDPARFFSEFWERRPAVMLGNRDRLSRLPFDAQVFQKAAEVVPRERLRAGLKTKGGDCEVNLTGDQVDALFAAGATIVVRGPHTAHPPLAATLAAMRSDLGYPGEIESFGFWSPPGYGYGLHFDPNGLFNIQISGRKRWRFATRSSFPFPVAGAKLQMLTDARTVFPWADIRSPSDEKFDEVVLEPGDVVYLPGGTWHEACAGDESSLALNIAFAQVPLHSLVTRRLEQALRRTAAWRRTPLPLRFAGGPEIDQAMADQLVSIVGELARAAVQGEVGAEPDPTAADVAGAPIEIEPTDSLRVPVPLRVERGVDASGSSCVIVSTVHGAITMGEDALPFVEKLRASERFQAVQVLEWIGGDHADWPEVQTVLAALIERGFIEREAPHPDPLPASGERG